MKWTLILSSAVLGVLTDLALPGWGREVVLTLGIFGSLVVLCRPWWSIAFWITGAATFALHLVLMLRFRTFINELNFPLLFLGAVVEIVFIAIILGFVFPDRDEPPVNIDR